MFLQVMSAAYTEEQLDGGDTRVVLRLPAALAPVKVAVLPLVKKDGMPEKAQGDRRSAKIRLQHRLRRKGFGRQTLPPAGCHRHTFLRDSRRSDTRRRYRDGASPRHDAAGASGHQRPARDGRRGMFLPQAVPETESVNLGDGVGRILAIDYGTKRTGIAVSDPLRIIAGGLETVPTKELEKWLASYCSREEVDVIVLGKPSRMDGTPSETWRYIEPLAARLRRSPPRQGGDVLRRTADFGHCPPDDARQRHRPYGPPRQGAGRPNFGDDHSARLHGADADEPMKN